MYLAPSACKTRTSIPVLTGAAAVALPPSAGSKALPSSTENPPFVKRIEGICCPCSLLSKAKLSHAARPGSVLGSLDALELIALRVADLELFACRRSALATLSLTQQTCHQQLKVSRVLWMTSPQLAA